MNAPQTELAEPTTVESTSYDYGTDETGSQYLTFILGGESYGVDILRVQEIKGWTPVTSIPNTPEYLRGVLDLRGIIVPIIDMRMRFCLEEAEYTALTVIIVLTVETSSGQSLIGVVVDSVSDVMNVNAEDIKPTPEFGASVNTEFLKGLATVGDNMVMLLDVDKMLTTDEMKMLNTVG